MRGAYLASKIKQCKQLLLNRKSNISIYDIFQPIFRISLITGMTPFDVRAETFKNNIFYPLWCTALAVTSTGLGMMDLLNRQFSNSMFLISDTTDFLLAWTNLLNDAAIMVCSVIFKNQASIYTLNRFILAKLSVIFQILSLLEQLQQLDQDFAKLNIISDAKQSYRQMRLEVIVAIILSSMLACFVILTDLYSFLSFDFPEGIISDTMIYRITLFCTNLMVLQFCTFLGVIRQRFNWLNRHIKTIAADCCKQNVVASLQVSVSLFAC